MGNATVDCEQCNAEFVQRKLCSECGKRICKMCWRFRKCDAFKGGHRMKNLGQARRVLKRVKIYRRA